MPSTKVVLHSLNLRSSFDDFLPSLQEAMEVSECTAFFLQDLGVLGPDGHPRLREALKEHHILTNSHPTNKSRTVALIINKEWNIVGPVRRDEFGCIVGTTVEKNGTTLFVASVYMPAKLNNWGMPESWEDSKKLISTDQKEAHNAYALLKEWCEISSYWIIGGDFNEICNDKLDRISDAQRQSAKHKFITDFLRESHGIDIWRQLFPHLPGVTFKSSSTGSLSRLDYFLASALIDIKNTKMTISHWVPKKDHAQISLNTIFPASDPKKCQNPVDDIPRPRLHNAPREKIALLKQLVSQYASDVLADGTQVDPDRISRAFANMMVGTAIQILGRKSISRKSRCIETAKLTAEIRTIHQARNIIRSLFFDEVKKEDVPARKEFLDYLLDRLVRMDLASVPTSNDIKILYEWSEKEALEDLAKLEEYAQVRKKDLIFQERQKMNKMFKTPKLHGKWLEYYFGKPTSTLPNFVIDPLSGTQVYDPDKMKELYLREGTLHLKDFHPCPPEHDEKEHTPPKDSPDENKREEMIPQKPASLPAWWERMYNRKAKGIDSKVWSELMNPTSATEVRTIIQGSAKDKSAGYDGVSIDLIAMLIEDGEAETNPCLCLLVRLINIALRRGETLKSWRKAVISMIPKRKDDGSFTNLIREMRPISVLQEFGKLASKILADRIGRILLQHPTILSHAQRAFLRDGSIRQCIGTLINVFEDFKEKHAENEKEVLFFLAYDQVKAYDSVQAYSIEASLLRFNLPPHFISYVLSSLNDASSVFKTYYGLTKEFPITTSVRQGDPLSPLIYIFITDALHEGLRKNPLFGAKTGYRFSNAKIRVASLGYADDTCICCESWKELWMMHEWVRDFCFYHNFQLNAEKCKFFISNWRPNDSRWLWSVDGKSKIHPQPPDTPFRYLGIWLSMTLYWGEQIRIMNRMVMDWKRRALVGQVDPAQLKRSVTELLIPKMELGLTFADITEQMCNAWTATIICTIAKKMASVHSMSREGFCLLAGIPHLWRRTQTIRVTELMVNLNSYNCAIGETTRARLCKLVNPPAKHPSEVLKHLQTLEKIKQQVRNRIAITLRELKKSGAFIMANLYDDLNPSIAETTAIEIKSVIEANRDRAPIHAYTDGSTDPNSLNCHSGVGIYITDADHKEVWRGGFFIRTDKNNFIAEIAAATTVINAVPSDIDCTMWIDSTATIHALQKGTLLSERRIIRSAGRAWLNWARQRLPSHVKMQHVRSHTGRKGPREIGNDTADYLANQYRTQGKRASPKLPSLRWEEPFYVIADNCVIQGDIRAWSKANESEELLKVWTKHCLSQSGWMKRNRKQILRMAEEVWDWAIEKGEGDAWIYFIFAVCNWLPTGRRLGKQDKRNRNEKLTKFQQSCQLCLSGEIDDLEHLMHCPALYNELLQMNAIVNRALSKWGLLHPHLRPEGERLAGNWYMKARQHFAETGGKFSIANDYLRQLVRAWLHKGNPNSYPKFERAVEEKLSRFLCNCSGSHTCALKNCYSFPKELLEILVHELTLAVDGMADALHVADDLFEEWWSNDTLDERFGAKIDFFKQPCVGRNVFINPPLVNSIENGEMLLKIIEKIKLDLTHEAPTRFLLVIPRSLEHNSPYLKAQENNLMEIARFADKSFAFIRPQNFWDSKGITEQFDGEISLFLCVNKESLSRDPIDWTNFVKKVKGWMLKNGGSESLLIPEHTDNLFRERRPPGCQPRVRARLFPPENDASLFRFFNGIEDDHRHPIGSQFGGLYKKINKWPRPLGFLGLLPTPFRNLVKRISGDATAHKEISKTIFFAGYQVWKARRNLVRKTLKLTPLSFKKLECKNPFHYLERTANLSSAMMTHCRCSVRFVQEFKSQDLRHFFPSLPKKQKTHSASPLEDSVNHPLGDDRDDLMIYAGDWGVPHIDPDFTEDFKGRKTERKICSDPPDYAHNRSHLGGQIIGIIPDTLVVVDSGLDHKHIRAEAKRDNQQTNSPPIEPEQELSKIEMPEMSAEELVVYEEATNKIPEDLEILENLAMPQLNDSELAEFFHIIGHGFEETKEQDNVENDSGKPSDTPSNLQRKSRKKRKKIKGVNSNKKRKKRSKHKSKE